MAVVEVTLPDAGYDVHVKAGALERLGEIVKPLVRATSAAVVVDSAIADRWGPTALRSLEQSGFRVVQVVVQSGETHKSLKTVQTIYDALLEARLERSSPLIALGGGVVGDTAGFAAATYLRGIPLIQCPTTLLAMVDASVGGKTGVNVPQGKNLIGAFHQPRAVVADPTTLATLTEREFRGGLAECVKHGVLGDSALFDWTESMLERVVAKDLDVLEELVARNVAVKAAVVVADEKEAGIRAHLNLGHTFGHAIERCTNYQVSHGEAVGLGMLAAARFAGRRSLCEEELSGRLEAVIERAGLPLKAHLPADVELVEAMRLDKKVERSKIRLVLPTRIGSVCIIDDATEEEIGAAFATIRAQ
ncbi:MAG: 3-dehydroquinate synthase [Bdellovibrionales bacterium]|nr:3-dehydroquinate synthase [Bdellovibrionales bacterium]